ncbi:uncharacterized protein PAC_16279 [Phialocephala subalpina]|uniref:Uncharacterized protein n=1 Tax=Phialocephala subalpina TaxID=576137 RepID=A0A1L7XMX9_9HELO|nr:uncharacterized protein PAC_16279 [Phialocephala subalpina]
MALKVAPAKSYRMRFVPLIAVIDSTDVGISGRSLSILCRSYTWWGGLNGVMAGGGGAVTSAIKHGSDSAFDDLNEEIERRTFHILGSELQALKNIERSRDEAQAELTAVYVEGGELIGRWADLKKELLEV